MIGVFVLPHLVPVVLQEVARRCERLLPNGVDLCRSFEPAIADRDLEVGIAGKPARGKAVRIVVPVLDRQLPPFVVTAA